MTKKEQKRLEVSQSPSGSIDDFHSWANKPLVFSKLQALFANLPF